MSYGASWGVWWGLSLERPAWASLSPDLIRDQERDGLLPAGTAAQLGGVIVSKRGRGTLRPELVVAAGPKRLAQPGGGTFADLYGSRWALGLYKGGPRLYQAQGGVWVDRADPDALAELSGARHVALAFDQAARPVVAWERDALVYVRQWSPQAAQYVTRGPWAGCDPLLISDAVALLETADSDVTLYHLDAARAAVLARTQREVYATARNVATLAGGAVLDQVVTLPYALQLIGEDAAGPAALLSAPYPVAVADRARGAATLAGGELVVNLYALPGADNAQGAATLAGGQLVASLYALPGADNARGAATLAGGQLVVNLYALPGADNAQGAATLAGGALNTVLFSHSSAHSATSGASFIGGSYG